MEANNDIMQGIILGLITDGFELFFAKLSEMSGRAIVGEAMLKKWEQEKGALQPLLKKATETVSEEIDWNGPARMEEVVLFLRSPEVETIVRQIFSAGRLKDKKESSLNSIRLEFKALFAFFLGLSQDQVSKPANLLLDTLIEGCERALDSAIDNGILSGHEAKSTFRYRMLHDELAAIQKNLNLLASRQKPSIGDIRRFEERYREQVATRHQHITPPNFDSAQKLPIDSIYVCPSFSRQTKKGQSESRIDGLPAFLSQVYRSVLLGNPGGGKSTLTIKICHELASRYNDGLFSGRRVTPILVILRDYGAAKKEHDYSILQFIEKRANSHYQTPPPPGAFDYLLLNGNALVIFDGLDELLDTNHRQEISSDIESFCGYYPSVPVLVTSREVGYEQAPLDERRFQVFKLAPFNDEQVREYSQKWFSTDSDLTEDQQTRIAASFFKESEIVSDLRSNPLMLALMCNIYRGERYIPRNRPEVYKKCSEMLFERWDKGRGIHISLPFESELSPAMMYLAHWIYSNVELQSGVTERELIAQATSYLCPRLFESRNEAEKAARDFIQFCRGRAWVFSDTGLTKGDEKLYQFTHRTFLEYFTAAHLVRNFSTPKRLMRILQPKISRQEWDVVSQLAFQLLSKNVEGAGDKLLSMLVRQQARVIGTEGWNCLSFAFCCLEFIVPRPIIRKAITQAVFKRSLKTVITARSREEDSGPVYEQTSQLLRHFSKIANENRSTVLDTLTEQISSYVGSKNTQQATAALEVAQGIEAFAYLSGDSDFCRTLSKRILERQSAQVERLFRKNMILTIFAHWMDLAPISFLIDSHGLQSIFVHSWDSVLGFRLGSVAEMLLVCLIANEINFGSDEILKTRLRELETLGETLPDFPRPWISELKEVAGFPTHLFDERFFSDYSEIGRFTANQTFAGFTLLAAMIERLGRTRAGMKDVHNLAHLLETNKVPILKYYGAMLLARFNLAPRDKAESAIYSLGHSPAQRAFAMMWIDREISLVKGKQRKVKLRT